MRVRFESKNTRTYKTISVVLAFAIVVTSLGLWYNFSSNTVKKAEAAIEISSGKVNNKSTKEIMAITSTFYNYKYNNEILVASRNQGSQTLTSETATIPYGVFDEALNSYYKDNSFNAGIYIGNFYPHYKNVAGGTYNTPIDTYHKFWWASNLAIQANENAVVTGLVDSTLNIDGNLTQNDSEVPLFSESFLSQTAEAVNPSSYAGKTGTIGAYKSGVDFPFRVERKNNNVMYYEFDSAHDVVRFNNMTNSIGNTLNDSFYFGDGTLNYYYDSDQAYVLNIENSNTYDTTPQFLPFNAAGWNQASVDYGFGTKFELEFSISKDGYLTNDSGEYLDEDGNVVDKPTVPITFEFRGDDDVWVFIDGKLVLDMGGAHKNAYGKIDFSTEGNIATTTVGAVSYDKTTRISSQTNSTEETQVDIEQNVTGTVSIDKTVAKHKMTIFYMERGMFNSNLYIKFNMTAIPNNHSLTIENKVNADNVNTGLKSQTLAIADKDSFEYSIQNKGTSSDDVRVSPFQYPTYENVWRVNTQTPLGLYTSGLYSTTQLASNHTDETKTEYYLYLNPNSIWNQYSAWFAAYFFDSNGNEEWAKMEQVGSSGIYRVAIPMDGDTMKYPSVIFVRMNADETALSWDSKWNQTEDLTIPNLSSTTYSYKITNWTTGSWEAPTDTTSYPHSAQVPVYPTTSGKFVPVSGAFAPLKGIAYGLVDPYGKIGATASDANVSTATSKTDITGITGDSGNFNLLYAQSATFKSQFSKDSTMQVVQSDSLSGSRKVSTYYSTNAVLDNGEAITNNQYAFKNKSSDSDEEVVHLTEIFTNTIKTGDLSVTKKLKYDEASEESFTMKLTLTTLFGASGDGGKVTDYSKITVTGLSSQTTLNSNGTFTIKAGETAKISGIPVGTTCQIKETNAGTSFKLGEATITGDNNTTMTVDGKEVTVTNVRKTGSLELKKVVKNGDGTTDSANTDSFTFTAILTAPAGENVNFSNYTIKVNDQTQTFTGTTATITASVKQGTSVKISGIPYGTTYEVTEASVSEYVQYGTNYNDSNKKIDGSNDTSADIVTIINKRKTGSLKLIKSLQGGTNNSVTDDDKTKTFGFTVTLTAPNNVDLSKYPMKYTNQNGDTESFTNGSTVLVSQNKSVTISGIPYGTTYTVSETSLAEDYTQNGNPSYSDSNKKIDGNNDTTADTVTITNKKKDLSKEAYLIITKYIDSLYYNSSDNPHEFTDNSYSIVPGNNTSLDAHGYLKYTNAEQDFTFTVSKYNTNGDFIESYYVVLKFEADSSTVVSKQYNGTSYNYAVSKAFKVDPGFVYEVVETGTGTGLSWRYDFDGVESSVTGGITSSIITKGVELTYSESSSVAQKAKVIFYDSRTDASRVIESDMSSITNNLKKAA